MRHKEFFCCACDLIGEVFGEGQEPPGRARVLRTMEALPHQCLVVPVASSAVVLLPGWSRRPRSPQGSEFASLGILFGDLTEGEAAREKGRASYASHKHLSQHLRVVRWQHRAWKEQTRESKRLQPFSCNL